MYVLVTSCDPLRIYVFNDGLARFATMKYTEPTNGNVVSEQFFSLSIFGKLWRMGMGVGGGSEEDWCVIIIDSLLVV